MSRRIFYIFSLLQSCAYWVMATEHEIVKEHEIAKEVSKVSAHDSDIKRLAIAAGIIFLQVVIIAGLRYVHMLFKKRILSLESKKLKSVYIHDYELINKNDEAKGLAFLLDIIYWILIAVSLLITVPFIFGIFPETKKFATLLFSFISKPVSYIWKSVVDYIPNLFTIIVICFIMRYIIMFCKYMADQIQAGNLKIPGFYKEWASPTYHILRFVLWAFTLAMVYPYLPGSDSKVFQGVSVLMGLLVSLGSSSVISNFIAGFVITYMRPFVKGDLIKLNDTVGFVVEKTALVTRIRTRKNEIVTVPNSFMMSAQTINFSESARDYGLIIHSEISIGYDAPWREIHRLLIESALATQGVSETPPPFVHQMSLSDFYPVYQINAYITDASHMMAIQSEMLANIQDKFAEAGIEIMSPHYFDTRDATGTTTIPKPQPSAQQPSSSPTDTVR